MRDCQTITDAGRSCGFTLQDCIQNFFCIQDLIVVGEQLHQLGNCIIFSLGNEWNFDVFEA